MGQALTPSVLIVDDSALMRQLLQHVITESGAFRVAGTAGDPLEAREAIKRLNPDIMTLDIEMPRMDGLSFLEKVMTLRPMPVVMFSTLTQKGAYASIRALELGAVECLPKPGTLNGASMEHMAPTILEALKAASAARVSPPRQIARTSSSALQWAPRSQIELIAVGASTGGVEALTALLGGLPAGGPPVVIVQHMPPFFTRSFAERLNGLSDLSVTEATDGEMAKPSHAYIAPGGKQLRVVRKPGGIQIRVSEGEPVSGHCPSVDVLFDSAATWGNAVIGVILTGMGRDGTRGLKRMRDNGAQTFGQNRASCVVYGMPQAAMNAGAVALEDDIHALPAHIVEHQRRSQTR